MNSFKNLPPDELRVFLHLYARWDQYWGGVETSTLASRLGMDEKNLKPLLEALSAAGHIEFRYDTVALKESVHNELKKAVQAHAMSNLQQGTLTLGTTAQDKVDKLKPRPRQNVLLELGYFWGKPGRNKMCVVHRSDREAIFKDVSDWHGVVSIEMDESDAWKHKLGKELQSAGIKVNLSNI